VNRQITLLIVSLSIAVAASFFEPYIDLSMIADKAPTVLAIFMAALFVRLARGLPPFPFDKVERAQARVMLAALEHLRRLYAHAFYTFVITIVASVWFASDFSDLQNQTLKSAGLGLFVFVLLWSLSNAYLIFQSDITLFQTQSIAMSDVLDSAEAEEAETSNATVRNSFPPK